MVTGAVASAFDRIRWVAGRPSIDVARHYVALSVFEPAVDTDRIRQRLSDAIADLDPICLLSFRMPRCLGPLWALIGFGFNCCSYHQEALTFNGSCPQSDIADAFVADSFDGSQLPFASDVVVYPLPISR